MKLNGLFVKSILWVVVLCCLVSRTTQKEKRRLRVSSSSGKARGSRPSPGSTHALAPGATPASTHGVVGSKDPDDYSDDDEAASPTADTSSTLLDEEIESDGPDHESDPIDEEDTKSLPLWAIIIISLIGAIVASLLITTIIYLLCSPHEEPEEDALEGSEQDQNHGDMNRKSKIGSVYPSIISKTKKGAQGKPETKKNVSFRSSISNFIM